MPWAKYGDDAATHPIVLGVLERGPLDIQQLTAWDRANLVFGFVSRCALHSAGHLTDHFISQGTVLTMGGPEGDRWAKEAVRAGYWTKTTKGGQKGYQLVDLEEFIHIRLKADVEWDRQQRGDARNTDLTMPVRLRDGDACRYCGHPVYWADKKGARGGTYDHRVAGERARTTDDLVVACRGCNGGRRDHPNADDRYPLLPVPLQPMYHPTTIPLLEKHGLLPRSGSQPAHATSASRPGGHRAPDSDPAASRPTRPLRAAQAATAHPEAAADSPGSGGSATTGSGSAGSGRDRDGPGGVPSPSPPTRRRRSRRGRPRTGPAEP